MSSIQYVSSAVVTSPVATVTLDSIPSIYNDLIVTFRCGVDQLRSINMKFNGDSGSNYSTTWLATHSGGTVGSARGSNVSVINGLMVNAGGTTLPVVGVHNFISYSNTNFFKTVLIHGGEPSKEVGAHVGLWRSTSAINSITFLLNGSGNFIAESSFTVWGVK